MNLKSAAYFLTLLIKEPDQPAESPFRSGRFRKWPDFPPNFPDYYCRPRHPPLHPLYLTVEIFLLGCYHSYHYHPSVFERDRKRGPKCESLPRLFFFLPLSSVSLSHLILRRRRNGPTLRRLPLFWPMKASVKS